MAVTIPIIKRSREFGYVVWKKEADFSMKTHLKDILEANVTFDGKDLGKKKIDWKFRRISVGWRNTRPLSNDKKSYVLNLAKDGKLTIKCQ